MTLYNADCLDILPTLPENSIDSMVCDPPAGINFMGLAFDSDRGGSGAWIDWLAGIMRECLRVLKPGAHALVWALPKVSHRTATALEDAGFEIRDVVFHLFCSGFPKSQDIGKMIDKSLGAERQVIGERTGDDIRGGNFVKGKVKRRKIAITAPSTDEAKKWTGWHTALKPALESWIMVRKPLGCPTIASNVLQWATGGLNIDACRVEPGAGDYCHPGNLSESKGNVACYGDWTKPIQSPPHSAGRYPAHLVCSCPDCLGEQARFFYAPKASPSERDGNTHPNCKPLALMRYLCRLITPPYGTVLDCFMGSGTTGVAAVEEGFAFVGIEKEKPYFDIAEARINAIQ